MTMAVNISIEGTLDIGKDLLDSLADRLVVSLGNSRRMQLPVQEDKLTSIIRYTLFEITSSCDPDICSLYKFIEEYLIVLAKTMRKVLQKVLSNKFIETNYQKLMNEYVEYIKDILVESDEEKNPTFWIVTIKIINSRFQQLINVYTEDLSSNVDKKDLRHKIILASVIMENNYLDMLCVEHEVCLTKNKLTSALLGVLSELTKAPHEKIKSFLMSFYRALFDTKFYTIMDEEFAHQLQIQLYEFVENPKRRLLLDLQKIVEDHLNRTARENPPRHVDLIHAILSDLDVIYVVQSSVPFTQFLESFHVFLKSNVKLNTPKVLLEIQGVISALAPEFFDKLRNQMHVLLEILLSKISRNIPNVKPTLNE